METKLGLCYGLVDKGACHALGDLRPTCGTHIRYRKRYTPQVALQPLHLCLSLSNP